jgi:hypothetical protein
MKKILLILTLTLVFSQKAQSQSQQEQSIGSILVEGLFTSKKEKKKIERENFVIDSTNNAIEISKKREIFARDSITKNRLVEEKKKSQLEYISWIYSCDNCKFNEFKINQTVAKTFKTKVLTENSSFGVDREQDESDEKYKSNIEEAKLRTLSVEIYADTTATNKIGVINLAELPLDEVFVEVAYKRIENENIAIYANTYSVNENHLVMIKSVKTGKAYVIRNYAYEFYDNESKTKLFKNYTDPLIITKEKEAVANFKIKLKSALSTIHKLKAIQDKHLFQERNMYGQVIDQYYDPSKFTKEERVTYSQLYTKLNSQNKIIQKEKNQNIGRIEFHTLLDTSSWDDISTIEHAISDYFISSVCKIIW